MKNRHDVHNDFHTGLERMETNNRVIKITLVQYALKKGK